LLLDQNLSFRLCRDLADVFPESMHVRLVGLAESEDSMIWEYAKANGYAVVTQDADFADMAVLFWPAAEGDLDQGWKSAAYAPRSLAQTSHQND
jgi:hypothetical protein